MRRLVLATAVLACVLVWLPAVARAAADDIPGTPLQFGQSVSGTLDSSTKQNDVYSIHLNYGEEVLLTVHNEPNHTGNHMYLLAPSTRSVLGNSGNLASASTYNGLQTGRIYYTPAVDGIYFVQIGAGGHNDTYDLAISGSAEKPPNPSFLRLRSSAASVKRGRSVMLSATLVDQASKLLGGEDVTLQSSTDGKNWKTVKSLSSGSGKYAAAVKVARSTWFRMTFAGDAGYGACVSRKLLVKAK